MKSRQLIVIAGPTAVGKTAVAVSWAKAWQTEIISADSRQCYRELNIGVARPSEKDLAEVPHHFIASHSIQENITAADFEKYALQKMEEIFRKKDTIILTGGTGLYIKAVCEGLDQMPEIPQIIRNEIREQYELKGLSWLQDTLKKEDPDFYQIGEVHNPHRMMRALEMVRATGQSILHFRKGEPALRNFRIRKFALNLGREKLYRNINTRVDQMMQAGLLEEVKKLLPYRHLNALNTVGYKELFAYLDGSINMDEAVESIKQNTRHYAKRQLTWFRKDPEYQWLDAEFPGLPSV